MYRLIYKDVDLTAKKKVRMLTRTFYYIALILNLFW